MKIPNSVEEYSVSEVSLARIVSEDSQRKPVRQSSASKSSKDS